jgi:serine acetyltransferase
MKPLAKDADLIPITQPAAKAGVTVHPLSGLDQRAHGQIGSQISKDIDIAHTRRWPNRPMTLASSLWLLIVSPGLRIILIHRLAHWLYLKRKNGDRLKWLWHILSVPAGLLKLTLMKLNTQSDISKDCEIEGGVCFSDQGNIIFGARKAGAGTVIGTRVTVGMNHHADMGRPEIGRNVWIGSDCVVFGAITIGDGATLLPGTVLSKSIPPGVVMQGNFPRLVLRNFDNTELRERQNLDAIQYVDAQRGN